MDDNDTGPGGSRGQLAASSPPPFDAGTWAAPQPDDEHRTVGALVLVALVNVLLAAGIVLAVWRALG
jgi:hypothetical protein